MSGWGPFSWQEFIALLQDVWDGQVLALLHKSFMTLPFYLWILLVIFGWRVVCRFFFFQGQLVFVFLPKINLVGLKEGHYVNYTAMWVCSLGNEKA